MSKFLRRMAVAAALAALGATSANAAPVSVSNGPVQAHATIVKPLTLTKVSDMDFGSITVLDAGIAHLGATGTLTCDASLTCAANGTPAEYNVTGTNNQIVTITKPPVTLTNAANPGTDLTLTLTGQDTVTLANAGAPGTNFKLGGDLNIPANTKEGTYQGDLNVTVNY